MAVTWKKLAFEDDVVKHSLATAANDFLVASGSGVIIKKTLAETKVILGSPIANVVEDTTPQLGGDLELNNKNVLHAVPGSDLIANGGIISATVDTNAEGIGAPLFMAADGHFDTADADASTTAPCVALALETGVGTKKVLLYGVIRNDAWNWTIGPGKASLIYLSTTTGALMQTADFSEFTTDDVIQVVGWAISADVMMFWPQLNFITKV